MNLAALAGRLYCVGGHLIRSARDNLSKAGIGVVSGEIARPGKWICFCGLFRCKGEAGSSATLTVVGRVIKLDGAARAIGRDDKCSCVCDSFKCATSYSRDRGWVD